MEHALTSLWSSWIAQPALGQLFSRIMVELLVAAVLGGAIGLERELKHRPAGLRTHMFICIGAAMFTVLSLELGGATEGTRIASQIIPGIGFIGAGSILRGKTGVTGLTTAATIFVAASIGMACGAGFYWLAVFATLLILLALRVLGWMEGRLDWKPLQVDYSVVTDKTAQEAIEEVNHVLEAQDKELSRLRLSKVDGKDHVTFSVAATRSERQELLDAFRQCEGLRNVQSTSGPEIE
ncbi:MAG TPA: MgtC/SapB family protein [Candidatus Angelobacter sp.]|nr:MgtC/SapB family protein [Candidatus Angelobacter sp.]